MFEVLLDSRIAMRRTLVHRPDPILTGIALTILIFGLIMVASASVSLADQQTGNAFYYLERQLVFALVGVGAAFFAYQIPLALWQRSGFLLLLFGLLLLLAVLVPGVGTRVNGSMRWIVAGPFRLQVSELAKLAILMYLAGYLVRRQGEVRDRFSGFAKPVAMLGLASVLLLLEPDFGAATVLLATAFTMMFIGGVRLRHFSLLVGLVSLAMAVLAFSSPYRLERLTTFLNPWADPFNSGFQLTQSLIAIGRGQWFGVGLGESVQKLFYLPEAHTDFLFAVLAEELGLLGALSVIGLYLAFTWRAFIIARRAAACGRMYAAYLSFGLGLWIGLQAFINVGVNMGILPTKGLTLPLMSSGGSSLVVTCAAVGLLLRAAREGEQGPVSRWQEEDAL